MKKLPPAYLRARRILAGRRIDLERRMLLRREPAWWPGGIILFTAQAARRQNARHGKSLGATLFLIGTNGVGALFALEGQGSVMVLDEAGLTRTPARKKHRYLAYDFETFTRAFMLTEKDAAAHRRSENAAAIRGISASWKKLHALLDGPQPPDADLQSMLMNLAEVYLSANRSEAFFAALAAFVRRHPEQSDLVGRLRAYLDARSRVPG